MNEEIQLGTVTSVRQERAGICSSITTQPAKFLTLNLQSQNCLILVSLGKRSPILIVSSSLIEQITKQRYEPVSTGTTMPTTATARQKQRSSRIQNNILRIFWKLADHLNNTHPTNRDYLSQSRVSECFRWNYILLMKKNGKKAKAEKVEKGPHLIQQLTGSKPKEETKEEEYEVIQCKYGIFCAHLRAAGKCSLPHRRHHFLLLNLVPPPNHLPDLQADQEEGKLSKKQRKQRKILQKTINQHIDVAALTKQQQINKETAVAEQKERFLQNMNEVERQVAEIVSNQSAQQYFSKLSNVDRNILVEVRRRSMIQLKKKNNKVHADVIDKEYRIAHRLIKESLKNKKQSLIEIYQDINHNTIPSVREYFETYFEAETGIPQQDPTKKYNLSTIMHSFFFRQVNQFNHQYSIIKRKSPLSDFATNTEFFNLMVPFLHASGQPFNRYILVDCEEDLSLTSASQLIAKDYALTFHTKCKPAPQYPFGQLQTNLQKFGQWVTKTSNKYREPNKDSNIILILHNFQRLFENPDAQQFEQEKLKQRRETFRKLLKVLQPIIYFLTTFSSQQVEQKVLQVIRPLKGGKGKLVGELQCLQQK